MLTGVNGAAHTSSCGTYRWTLTRSWDDRPRLLVCMFNLGDLRRSGFIEERGGLTYATESGIQVLGDKVPTTPTSHQEAMQLWRRALRSGAFSMLETIVGAGDTGMLRDQIAADVGMTASGGTFNTYLGDLRRNGLITERDKRCIANDILFPKGNE